MTDGPLVIKIGGSEIEREDFLPALAAIIKDRLDQRVIIVHGGGGMINELLKRFDIEPFFVAGQRVTDEQTLVFAEMVLSGLMNKQIVRALLAADLDAIGLSGIDRALIMVKPANKNLGRVGEVTAVREEILLSLLAEGVIPVISPISLGPDGAYNVNADLAAAAIASAVSASEILFLTGSPGIVVNETTVRSLTPARIEALIHSGLIHSGMVPKVGAALAALRTGVGGATITDLSGWQTGLGTDIHLTDTEGKK